MTKYCMTKKEDARLRTVLTLCFVTTLFLISWMCFTIVKEHFYFEGQKDYANGVIKIELVNHPNKTTSWEWKKEEPKEL
ncbi:unnamed protein product [marine sediment metagenome]|uniref:Uncharacterized protein n=1 Tax=marine sediment metagenome TaxID=412755 RepID=X0UFP0_9ZZZZ